MKEEVINKISKLPLSWVIKINFINLLELVDIPEKKYKTFLNLQDSKKSIGFLYKILIYNAYKYGIPKIYINDCITSKKNYKSFKDSKFFTLSDKARFEAKLKMHRNYEKLSFAVLEVVKIKNSRKNKIESILEKIYDKNN
ncbi:MAG: hypothetical protein ACOC2W_02330 [bacterium]